MSKKAWLVPLCGGLIVGGLFVYSAGEKRDYGEGQLAGICADRAEDRDARIAAAPRGASTESIEQIPAKCFAMNSPRWRVGDSARILK